MSRLIIDGWLGNVGLIGRLLFFSNIKGYYRFKQYCEAEGGLRVYEPLERNVGWLANDKYSAMAAAQLDGAGFVRYFDASNIGYDVHYKGGIRVNESSYDIVPADLNKFPIYHWVNKGFEVTNEDRLHLYGEEIYRLRDDKILSRYYIYGYQVFNRKNTPLDMPSERMCHAGSEGGAIVNGSLSINSFKKAFKN